MAIWSKFFGNAASSAAGFGLGAAVSPALRPITQEVANETWQRYPNRPLSPGDAADAVVRDLLSPEQAADEASMSGYDAARFGTMRGLAGEPPGNQQLLELLNRGFIDEAGVDRGLRQSRMRPEWYAAFKQLRHVLVPVSDLVRFAVREVYSPGSRQALELDAEFPQAFAGEAAKQGLSEQSARDYWAAHWQLPSYGQASQMLFRGEINQAQFDELLKALDYAPTWRNKLANIAKAIPGTSDMIRFAVREVYDDASRRRLGLDQDYPDRFTSEAAKHGLSEQDARDYWAAHWQLPSPTQGSHMLWRGEINAAELDGLLKALDYSPTWRGKLAAISHLVPGRIDLRRMLAAGVIDRAEVHAGYVRLGYTAKDAETLTKFAEQQASSGPTVHQKWADKARTSLFTVAHAEYMDESLDVAGANATFDIVGVPAAERPAIFAAWNREAKISRLELTPAQIKKAYRKALYTEAQALEALAAHRMSVDDAKVFLQE